MYHMHHTPLYTVATRHNYAAHMWNTCVCVMHTCTCVLNTNMDTDPHVLHKTTYAHRQTSTPLPMRAFTGSSWVHPTPPSPFTRSGPGKPNPKSQGNKESLPRKVGFRRCSQPGPSFVWDTEAARVGAGVDGGGQPGSLLGVGTDSGDLSMRKEPWGSRLRPGQHNDASPQGGYKQDQNHILFRQQ